MEFKLIFVDGYNLTLDSKGDVVAFHDPDGNLEGTAEDFPLVHGIWYDDEKCTIPWDEVVDYKHTDFHLTSCMYLDNGQVVDEGEIVAIEIDGVIKWDTREDIGAIQSEMAKGYSDYIKRTAPWIIGGDE